MSFSKIGRPVHFTHHTDAVPFVLERKFCMCNLYTYFMIPIEKSLADRRLSNFKKQRHSTLCCGFVLLYPYKSQSLNCMQLVFFQHPDIKNNKGEGAWNLNFFIY